MPLKVLTIGNACVDIILENQNNKITPLKKNNEIKDFLLLEDGSKIEVQNLSYFTGGGATNSACCFKKLGFDASIFCKISNDSNGKFILKELKKNKIKTDNIVYSKNTKTATSIILPTSIGDRIIFVYRGANNDLSINEIPTQEIKNSNLIYITSLSENAQNILLPILKNARENKIHIAVNPGKSQVKTKEFLENLKFIDFLILNKNEAQELFKIILQNNDSIKKINLKIGANTPELIKKFFNYKNRNFSIAHFFKKITNFGPKIIAVTNGFDGVYVSNGNSIYFHESIKSKEIVNSLGAGDAFGSTFVGSLIQGKSIEKAIFYSLLNASSVTNFQDAKSGILSYKKLEIPDIKTQKPIFQIFKI